jgi:microcystin-dependent protein
MSSYRRDYYTLNAHERPTVGDSKTSVISSDHKGWLKCDGRLLSTKEFYFLFQVIRYDFGGAGGFFNLPNAGGTVPGVVGTGVDANSVPFTLNLGQQVGEYVHTLTIPEIPSHNHGVAAGLQNAANNSTSVVSTGISVNVSTTRITDSGHSHSYDRSDNSNSNNGVAVAGSAGVTTDLSYATNSTGSGNANIVDPGHSHPITDPGHSHVLKPAGGDLAHNNIQPTLPVGNLFIYSGKVNYGSFPYTSLYVM